MTGYLISFSGDIFELPVLIDWEICHSIGNPCDAFKISFLYEPSMAIMLSDAYRFKAIHEGQTIFFGVVDEYEIRADISGLTASVNGRGLAALLLDNEAEAARYAQTSLQFILDKHVTPYGITDIKTKPMPNATNFTVNSGISQWRVLENFAWFSGGIQPRFSVDGVLLLDGSKGVSKIIEDDTAIAAQVFSERRFGIISSVLVKNQAWGISNTVDNHKFIARGGNCRRVVNVPRYTNFDTMRHTGEYQIARSEDYAVTCELTLLSLFAAFPGDLIELKNSPSDIQGSFQVYQSRCWAGAKSAGTHLSLRKL